MSKRLTKNKSKQDVKIASSRGLDNMSKPGPEAERLKLGGNWKTNVQTALGKKRPKDGWPKA